MKAVILAAGRATRLGDISKDKPKCLLDIDNTTILGRTTAILKEYGINDITIVVGAKGDVWNRETYAMIKDIVPNVIINERNDVTHSGYSCALAMQKMEPQTFLVLDGDLIFRREALETILTAPPTSLLTRPTSSPLEKGGKVKGDNGRIAYCGVKRPNKLPWDIYSGLMKVGKDIFNDLMKKWLEYENKEILYVLNSLCKKHSIHMRRIGYYFSKEGGGGSDIEIMTIVRKHSSTERRIKLAEEVKFLEELPENWKKHFPKVVSSKIADDYTYYEMPRYELPSLRRLVLSGVFSHRDALEWIDKILEFKFSEMYPTDKKPVSKTYMDFMHIQRIWKRLQETYDKSLVFREIIPREQITINGKSYKNIPISLCLLEQHVDLLNRCLPSYVTHWGHFDMHFANILIDIKNDNFILVDPRGYKYCDYYYDLGKIWHSAHGLYDLISERMFTLSGDKGQYSYTFWDTPALEEYQKMAEASADIFSKYTRESKEETMLKVEFNEVCHFCSFMPFFFDYDHKEHRALISYLRGVELINAFEEKYLPGYRKVDWINVNYPKDWKEAGEQEWRLF